MKKQFTTLFLMAAALLMPLSLTSCGEDVQLNENGGGNTNPKKETKFSSRPIGTRTSLSATPDANNKFPFYWETGDNIWVDENKNGTFTLPSSRTEIDASNKNLADFFFNNANLTEKTYDLVYTGNNSTRADQVTITTSQTQSEWNNSSHIGISGDCGVATATQDAIGDYSFELNHMASYLIIYPYINSYWDNTYTLTSINIVSNNTIAGTYRFSKSGGLNASTVTNASNAITLKCGTSGFALNKAAETTATNFCVVVMQPGAHNLTITYNMLRNGTNCWLRKTFSHTVTENGVTIVKHVLRPEYTQWDSSSTAPFSANSNTYNTATGYTNATMSCKEMPNVNQLWWYVAMGGGRWDNTTEWSVDGGATTHTGGVWLRKRQYINNFNANTIGDGTDKRGVAGYRFALKTDTYKNGGKPDDSVINQFFFLPALGNIEPNVSQRDGVTYPAGTLFDFGKGGWYWSSSSGHNYNPPLGANLTFTKDSLTVHGAHHNRARGFIGNVTSFGQWFQ